MVLGIGGGGGDGRRKMGERESEYVREREDTSGGFTKVTRQELGVR